MATIYLSSVDGSDSDDGSTWALAKATLAAALTAAGAGGTVYVDSAHAETQGTAMTLTSPGTAASPVTVLSVDRTGDPEPPTATLAGATVTTTSGSSINYAGFAYVHGVSFVAGSGASTTASHQFNGTAAWGWTIENGAINVATTGASSRIVVGAAAGNSAALLRLVNTTVSFGNVNQQFQMQQADFEWLDTPSNAIAGTIPTTLFVHTGRSTGRFILRNLDLDQVGSGKSLVSVSAGSQMFPEMLNCKLNADVSDTAGSQIGPGAVQVSMVNVAAGDTQTRYRYYRGQGTISEELTIVRTGGANDGSVGFGRKFVSGAGASVYWPLKEARPWVFFAAPGSYTVRVELVNDGVTLTDAEFGIDADYMGTNGFPLGVAASSRPAPLVAPTNLPASDETWTTTGLSSPVEQYVEVSFTTLEYGLVQVRPWVGRASTTVYACPKILDDSAAQYMLPDGSIFNAPPSEGGGGGVNRAALPSGLSYAG